MWTESAVIKASGVPRAQPVLQAIAQHLTDLQARISELRQTNVALRRELSLLTAREAQASHDAYHDALTRLPNRRLLLDRLQQALARAVRHDTCVVLMFLDLDRFKAVNDKLGHAVGDKLLRVVADRLAGCIRSADTACRYGGDEFVVMLPEVSGSEDCAAVERKVRAALTVPYVIDGVDIATRVSIGSAMFPGDANNRTDLLQQADIAMYRAKVQPPYEWLARHVIS